MAEITGKREIWKTDDAWLAAALITMGAKPRVTDNEEAIERIVIDGREVCLILFEPSKLCDDVARQWANIDQLRATEPEHPLCYLHAMMHNRQRILDAVKQKRRLIFRSIPGGYAFKTEKITQ